MKRMKSVFGWQGSVTIWVSVIPFLIDFFLNIMGDMYKY